ncbi:MAG: Lrp/AsnC family transcriptional regulator [bacterium]|nr:Lrp/AsnC family transcriptional regulator [bacterium]
MKNLLELEPIQKFIASVGKDVERFFGKDDGCIVYLRPDGAFYGIGLYEWLKRKKKNLTLATMEDDGQGLEEQKVKGRKVLLVDNDIITGKGYKRSTEAIRIRKDRLGIQEVKFAVFSDRVGLANFSVAEYSSTPVWGFRGVDALDLKIIKYLSQDGRASFADIGKGIKLSSVAVKNRVDKLMRGGILSVMGELNINRFYAISACLLIEATPKAVQTLIEKLGKKPEVYHVARRSGRHNLVVSILGQDIEGIEDFVDKEVRLAPGVSRVEVVVGELPAVPKTFIP